MIGENGMSAVTVKKTDLLDILQKNREAHAAEYKAARAGYEVAFVEKLTEHLELAKAGKKFIPSVDLSIPEDHTREYDRIIRMLQMSVNETIVITESEFTQYVLDEWNWMRHTKMVNSAYIAQAPRNR